VKAPSGVLLILDPGYLSLWCHDRLPHDDGEPAVDLAVEGPDAEAAGTKFDRQSHPRFLFDIPEQGVPEMEKRFGDFVREHGLNASLKALPERVRHRKRVDLGLERGRGAAKIQFHGLWACAVGGVPRDRELRVTGERMPPGPDAGRWRRVLIRAGDAPVATSEKVGDVMVDHARLLAGCADGLGSWVHERSLDGKADFVFWGRDALRAAAKVGAPRLEEDLFGWVNLETAEAARKGHEVENVRSRDGLKFATDFRPHSHNHVLLRQVRASKTESGEVALGNSTVCGFATTWGDGVYPVYRDLAGDGSLVRIRVELGNDAIVARQRAFDERFTGAFSKTAVVSKKALEEGRFVGWLYREKPDGEDDSGWRVFAGHEDDAFVDDAGNFTLLTLGELVDRDRTLEEILRRPEGSAFERRGANEPFRKVDR
jgi:hypothetical protein